MTPNKPGGGKKIWEPSKKAVEAAYSKLTGGYIKDLGTKPADNRMIYNLRRAIKAAWKVDHA